MVLARLQKLIRSSLVQAVQQDKIDVNGADAHPLYTFLKEQTKSGDIKWNYTKFLVDRKGVPRKCFGSLFDPIDFEDDVSPACPLLCARSRTFTYTLFLELFVTSWHVQN